MTDIMTPAQEFESPADALAHYGKKGMKWGVRNEPGTSNSRSAAKAEVKDLATSARDAIRSGTRATTSAEHKAAAKKYEDEVLKRIQTPEFKAAFDKANTMGKGEMAAHVLLAGPAAALTIPMAKQRYSQIRKEGYEYAVDHAHRVMRELRQP